MRYVARSSHDATRMMRRSVIAPVSTAASGNTSWMLNTSGARWAQATNRPVRPSVNGGDMAITASARRHAPPAAVPAHAASSENPAKPAARRDRLRLSLPGNGWIRRMVPHGVVSRRANRPLHPGSMA